MTCLPCPGVAGPAPASWGAIAREASRSFDFQGRAGEARGGRLTRPTPTGTPLGTNRDTCGVVLPNYVVRVLFLFSVLASSGDHALAALIIQIKFTQAAIVALCLVLVVIST